MKKEKKRGKKGETNHLLLQSRNYYLKLCTTIIAPDMNNELFAIVKQELFAIVKQTHLL